MCTETYGRDAKTVTVNEDRQRLLTFGAIGVLNTFVDVVIFLILRHVTVQIILANIISTSVALTGSYFLNKRFTFRATTSTRRSLPLFLLITIVGLWVLQPIVIKLVLILLHTTLVSSLATTVVAHPGKYYELIAKLAATPATLTWNFVLYKRVVFKSSDVV